MAVNVDRGLAGSWNAHGWSLVLRGAIAVVFGVLAIVWPNISLAVLLVLFGIFAIVDGIVSIVAAVATPEGRRRWWALVAVGIIGIAAGVITFAYPGITTLALLVIIAVWALITGVLMVITAIQGPSIIEHRWAWGLSGVLSIAFGVLLLVYPLSGILAVVWLIGLYAIMFGATQIMLGLEVAQVGSRMRGVMQH